jgi:hypothetical protein
MSEKNGSAWSSVVTVLVAVASVALNVAQYIRAEESRKVTDQQRAKDESRREQDESRRSSPDCWFVFATDRTVADLLGPNGKLLFDGKPPVLAQVDPYFGEMNELFLASRTKKYSFNDKLAGAFFVVHNVDSSPIHGVRLSSGTVTDRDLVGPLSVGAGETLFVPLDFVSANDRRSEPDLPSRVTVHYQEGRDIVVEPSRTRVSILRGLLVRALIGQTVDPP